MADLEAGRSRPLRIPAPLEPRRPRRGGATALATLLGARSAAALRLPTAARLLERLWFTPWQVGDQRPWPEDARPFHAVVDGEVLPGWEVGEGPTVLLVHGWGGRSTDLAAMAGRLAAAGHRAVAVDLPAHGTSAGRTTDLFELAEAVGAAGRHAGPLHGLVAHSLGSVAALLAIADGLAVERVAVLAPPASLDRAVTRTVRQVGLSPTAEWLLRQQIEHRYGPDVWDRLDVAVTATQVRADVLVVHDADDREVPVCEGVQVAKAFGVEPVLTTGLGHGRVLIDPVVTERVLAHLARVCPPSRLTAAEQPSAAELPGPAR